MTRRKGARPQLRAAIPRRLLGVHRVPGIGRRCPVGKGLPSFLSAGRKRRPPMLDAAAVAYSSCPALRRPCRPRAAPFPRRVKLPAARPNGLRSEIQAFSFLPPPAFWSPASKIPPKSCRMSSGAADPHALAVAHQRARRLSENQTIKKNGLGVHRVAVVLSFLPIR